VVGSLFSHFGVGVDDEGEFMKRVNQNLIDEGIMEEVMREKGKWVEEYGKLVRRFLLMIGKFVKERQQVEID
jgi:hypothetical protein